MIVDFHSHVLPGIDDGSRSVEESLEMLRMEYVQGIDRVVATPHFYAHRDTMEHFLQKRQAATDLLKEAAIKSSEFPEVLVGAEVYYFRGISNSEQTLGLTIEGKSCILIEMPYAEWTESMYQELETIYMRFGITPIIAHIDRYIRPFHARNILNRLAELPVLIQANADCAVP